VTTDRNHEAAMQAFVPRERARREKAAAVEIAAEDLRVGDVAIFVSGPAPVVEIVSGSEASNRFERYRDGDVFVRFEGDGPYEWEKYGERDPVRVVQTESKAKKEEL
jgi:hypothetical protein